MGRLALFQEENQSSDAGNDGHDDFQNSTGNTPGKFGSYIRPSHEAGDDLDKQGEIKIAFQQIAQTAKHGNGQDDHLRCANSYGKGQPK